MRGLCSILALALVLFLASSAGAEEKFEPQVVYRPNAFLVGAGGVTCYASYGVSAGIGVVYFALIWPFQAAFTNDNTPAAFPSWLLVPVAGPVLAAQTGFADDNPRLKPWLYGFSAVQGIGFAMLGAGFIFKERHVVGPPAEVSSAPRLMLGPGPGGSAGMSLGFTFE